MSNGPMLTVRLLGQFSLKLDDTPLEVPSRPAQSLLAWLILHPGVAHRRERLAGLFWPDVTEKNARNNLRHALWRMRRALPDGFVQADKISIRWEADADWWLDVNGLTDPPTEANSADALLPVLQACAGELLPGFYDEWVVRQREHATALYEERVAHLLELLLAESRWRETIEWAEKWIAQGNTPEPAYRALMQANASLGDRAGALAVYQRCIDALERELGVPPSPETEALAGQIRNAPFTIHNSQFPSSSPPSSPPSQPVIPSNLPAPTTPLIGREEELAELGELLADEDHRLLTIVGPGGMGKSRLAVAAGHAADELFPDGVFLVELTPLVGPEAIPRAIGDAVGYPYPNDSRPLRQQIAHYLHSRRILLLLDNFEHLLDGTTLLLELLQAAPGLHLLVTSRERLRLQAETLFWLRSLDYPTADEAINPGFPYAGAQLFLECARRTRHSFAPDARAWPAILRICRLVDGMPLALILAAGWTEHLHPAEIADEIAANLAFLGQDFTDLAPRHRTMEAVFAQSWQRLEEAEKETLMGLSIFTGGFDRESAQAVSGATLLTLTRLVDKALVWRTGKNRYDLHELIRQFSRQKLAERGEEEATRARHSRWFLGLLACLQADLKGKTDAQAIQRLEMERQNMAAGWRWAAQHAEIEGMLGAVETLGIFYDRPGRWSVGEELLTGAIQTLGDPPDPQGYLLRMWLLAWHGVFLHRIGQVEQARQHFTHLLAQLDDDSLPKAERLRLQAFAYLHRGGDLMTDRQRGETGEDLRRALALYEKIGDDWWMIHTLSILSNWELFNGQLGQAWDKSERAVQLARRLGYRNGEATALERMSFVAEHMGEAKAGVQLARDALALENDPARRNTFINRLTFALLAVGEFEESVALTANAVQLGRSNGYSVRALAFLENTLARGYLHLGRFAKARTIAEGAVQQWREVYGWEQPFILRTVSRALLALGDAAESRRLILRTVEAQRQMGNDNVLALSGALLDDAYPALALGALDEARQMLIEGLDLTQRSEAFDHCCRTLPAIALLLAEEGRLPEAAFVASAIQRYPRLTNSHWIAAVALDRLYELLAHLPAEVQNASVDRAGIISLPELTDLLQNLLQGERLSIHSATARQS